GGEAGASGWPSTRAVMVAPATDARSATSRPAYAATRIVWKRPPIGRPYGTSEANTIRSAGTRANNSITSSAEKQDVSYTALGWPASLAANIPWSAIAAWASTSPTSG